MDIPIIVPSMTSDHPPSGREPGLRVAGRKLCLLLLLTCTVFVGKAGAQPDLPAVMTETAPVIDGDISDSCWKHAPSVTDFYYVQDGSRAAEPTTTWLCYDRDCIYLAFYCKDSRPDRITAQQKKRGGSYGSDDWVGFDLDCYGDHKRVVWFDASAIGVQNESLQSGDASKIEWKGDWLAGARRVSDGYTVEMAVPFAILQYDPNRTSMGIAFIRRHSRLDQWWWSPNVGPETDARKFYLWQGLRLPRPRARPQVMGYSLLGTGQENEPRRAGLDLKHAFTPSLTGVLTVNPDFKNVEQRVESIDFTYNERYLSESRPFFLEGGNFFPGRDVFYTRDIRTIDAGAKMYGKIGPYSLGFAHARDFGDSDYTVMQVGHEWPARGTLWLAGVDCSARGKRSNLASLVAGDVEFYEGDRKALRLYGHLISADNAAGSGNGRKYELGLSSADRPRQLGWSVERTRIDPAFQPYLGYVPEKDIVATSFYTWFYDQPAMGRISDWGVDLSISRNDHTNGTLYYNSMYAGMDCSWRSGAYAYLGVYRSHRPPYQDRSLSLEYAWGQRDLYRRGSARVEFGRMAGGDYLDYRIGQGLKIGERLSLDASYQNSRVSEPSPEAYTASLLIGTLAYDIDTERTVAGRAVAKSGRTNLYMAFRQRVRAGMDAYLIFGDPNAGSTRSAITLKLIQPL